MRQNKTTIYDDPNSPAFKLALETGLTMPIKALCILWGRDITTITRMARLGRIPGAYRKGTDWWFFPKQLTEPDDARGVLHTTVFSSASKPIQPRRNGK